MTAVIAFAVAVVIFSAIAEAVRRIRRDALDLGDPPPLSDERADELRRVMRKDGEQR